MGSSKLIVILVSSVVATFLSWQVTGFPAMSADDGAVVVVDPDDLAETYGDDYMSPVLMKRFFTNHPSDYNPMRRLPQPRGSKREDVMPYHPVPRVVSIRRGHGHSSIEDFGGENDGYIESGRQKKQTRAATLIFRLGSLGMRRKPTVPPGPTA